MNNGVIRSIRGLVVAVQFDDQSPDPGELLIADSLKHGLLLVDHLDRDNIAVCLNVLGDNSLQKNMAAGRTNKSIQVPVGAAMIGRIFDAMGRPLDGLPMPEASMLTYRDINQVPLRTASFKAAKTEILETGIKVIDFFTPFVKGRKTGIIGGAGVGKTVLTMELMHNVAKP